MNDFACQERGGSRVTVYITKLPPRDEREALFARLLSAYCARERLPVPCADTLREPRGKPFLAAGGISFSLSHSGGLFAAAFARERLGLDIQLPRPCRAAALARRFFAPEEQALVSRDEAAFFPIWTAKESYVKFTGEGITAAFARFSAVRGGALAEGIFATERGGAADSRDAERGASDDLSASAAVRGTGDYLSASAAVRGAGDDLSASAAECDGAAADLSGANKNAAPGDSAAGVCYNGEESRGDGARPLAALYRARLDNGAYLCVCAEKIDEVAICVL